MGKRVPQVLVPQVTVQSTPPCPGSFPTKALTVAWPPVGREVGGAWRKLIETPLLIFIVNVMFLVLSAVEVAVRFTVLEFKDREGATAGATNVVAPPLSV
jgi:hypothetical protein